MKILILNSLGTQKGKFHIIKTEIMENHADFLSFSLQIFLITLGSAQY